MLSAAISSIQRKVFFLNHRLKRAPSFWKWVIFVIGAFSLWFLLRSQRGHGKAHQDIKENYCNFPIRAYGDEGSLPRNSLSGKSGLQLKMAQVLIRHGDRTPALPLPNIDQLADEYGCSFDSPDLHSTSHIYFKEYLEAVPFFKQRKLSYQAKIHSLHPSAAACQFAQLTKRGFLQHFQLGRHFSNAYEDLLGLGFLDGQLYVRSTNRERTVQSAAALLYGLLTKDAIKKGLVINITTDTWFRENDDGKLQACPALHKVQKTHKQTAAYRKAASEMEPLMLRIAQLLRAPRIALPSIVYLTDAVTTRTCHGHPLPCGPGGCFTEETAAKLLRLSEQAFVNNYTGIAQIVSHPLLTQVTQRMIDKSQGRTSLKFALYSGHDTTILPVLLALGIHNGKWSPYATRVVFELWKEPSPRIPGLILKDSYFRVLVNGKVVTKKIPFCQNSLYHHSSLCPVGELLRWLSSNYGMKQHYLNMCEAKPGELETNSHQESVEDRV